MYFPSKKDLWLSIIMWGTIMICIVPSLIEPHLVGIILGLLIAIFIGWFWFSTGYLVKDGMIKIKYGLYKKIVPIKEISRINKTKTPFSAPALSIDRLEIIHGKFFDGAIVSPVKKREFIELLIKENPNIQLDEQVKQLLESDE